MLPQPKAREAVDSTPKDIIIPQREKPGYIDQEEDELQNDIQEEATVLGSIHILCCLVISSFGAILDFSSYSSHLKPAVSTMLMTGYPFVGALCFAITGILSIISGKKSTKPFAMSSTTSSAVSSVVAGAGLFLLTYSLGTLSQLCDSEKEHESSVPHSGNHDLRHETKNCVPDCVSLMAVLVVMLLFSVLEFLLAAYASVFWWKQVYSNNPGSSFSLPQSQDHIKHVKAFFKVMDNCWP
ncbi:membrane-spanning 4-domains subfamily A member 7-like [Molossus molossus]|uniref:Membrane spanning 4-domains A7 n=1 Tax=Molossus molossus TaxID=27622 RepID=A0A7J8ESL0_MOLMO|nr:membrane-spanning 4-domains subfamily A member 7-like [Molossus molossus]KAF6438295.1 membrane spanning 4-domains A7 [Molossus molossus]